MKKFIFFLLFIVHFTFNIEHCEAQSGWYQVPLPMNGTIWNIQFLNRNLGWIRMVDTANQNSYLLRTTNGGTNFTIIGPQHVGKFYFFNDTLGYGLGVLGNNSILSKTTNSGFNWTTVLTSSEPILCFHFINPDTGWIGMFDGSNTSLIKMTVNGCQSFSTIWTDPGQGVDDILFTKPSVGGQYYGWINESGVVSRTTNSGYNWIMTSILYEQAMFFLNKDTGWVSTNNGGMLKTINGGMNWVTEYLPNSHVVLSISFTNPRRGWGWGGPYYIYATSNGGDVWGKQTIPILGVNILYFIDSLAGWAGSSLGLIHTTDGGGPITQITNHNKQIAKDFIIYQNYPNPFNNESIIIYKIENTKAVNVKIMVHDILGRNLTTLVNEKKSPGVYEVKFNGSKLSSGVYYYTLFIEGEIAETRRMAMIK